MARAGPAFLHCVFEVRLCRYLLLAAKHRPKYFLAAFSTPDSATRQLTPIFLDAQQQSTFSNNSNNSNFRLRSLKSAFLWQYNLFRLLLIRQHGILTIRQFNDAESSSKRCV